MESRFISFQQSGDNTKVWVVISRSRNRYVGELRHRESDKIHEQVVGECVQCQDEEHSQGERSEARQNFGWCRDRPWRARRWLCCRRGIHRTRIVSLANDCCKSDGCCCEITRMRWTSRRRSISLHPSKNGGRSKVVLNYKVWMSRYMDTSSTTQVAQIFVRHRRPSGSSWTNFVRSPACWLLVERHFEEVLLGLGMGKSTELRMPICSSKTRIVLIGIRGWHQNGWKNRIWLQCGRNWWNLLILTNQHHVSIMYMWDELNMNVNRTQTLSIKNKEMFESRISATATENIPGWENLHAKTVAWSYDIEGGAKNCACPLYALKWSWNACTWLELVDLTFFGPQTSLLSQSPDGHELVTDD